MIRARLALATFALLRITTKTHLIVTTGVGVGVGVGIVEIGNHEMTASFARETTRTARKGGEQVELVERADLKREEAEHGLQRF